MAVFLRWGTSLPGLTSLEYSHFYLEIILAAPTPDPKPGDRFGMLKVVSEKIRVEGKRYVYFDVLCDCGNSARMEKSNLIRRSISCGCHIAKVTGDRSRTHGKAGSPIYHIWNMMKQRCNLPSNSGYENYGGRGIKVSPDWETFENFYRDVGDPPFEGASLERKDANGNYCKENVVWATREEQANNTRKSVRFEYQGVKYTIKELAEKFGINKNSLASRLYGQGMPVEEAVSRPIMTPEESAKLAGSGVGGYYGRTVGSKLYEQEPSTSNTYKIVDNIEISNIEET